MLCQTSIAVCGQKLCADESGVMNSSQAETQRICQSGHILHAWRDALCRPPSPRERAGVLAAAARAAAELSATRNSECNWKAAELQAVAELFRNASSSALRGRSDWSTSSSQPCPETQLQHPFSQRQVLRPQRGLALICLEGSQIAPAARPCRRLSALAQAGQLGTRCGTRDSSIFSSPSEQLAQSCKGWALRYIQRDQLQGKPRPSACT